MTPEDIALTLSTEQLICALNKKISLECNMVQSISPSVSVAKLATEVSGLVI